MIVSFKTKNLRDCCASLERAVGLIGAAHAQDLVTILSDAEAAESADELIDLYSPDAILDDHFIVIPIGPSHRLWLAAVGAKICRNEASIDWSRVIRLKVMDIS